MGNKYPKKQKPLKITRIIKGLGVSNWWSRGDLNPRPPVLRCRYYMLSRVYSFNPQPPDRQGALDELCKF